MLLSDLLAMALAKCKFEEKESPPGRINSSNGSSETFNSLILLSKNDKESSFRRFLLESFNEISPPILNKSF